jgi:hypothetical protein
MQFVRKDAAGVRHWQLGDATVAALASARWCVFPATVCMTERSASIAVQLIGAADDVAIPMHASICYRDLIELELVYVLIGVAAGAGHAPCCLRTLTENCDEPMLCACILPPSRNGNDLVDRCC